FTAVIDPCNELIRNDNTLAQARNTTSVIEKSGSSLVAYPNPTSGRLQVQIDGLGRLFLFNAAGQLLIEQVIDREQDLNLLDQRAGVYFLVYKGENGSVEHRKVVKVD
ncbi:MAG: T9SS type A sorting domain-containing protein, partial [Bacteroidota bacterium]